MLEIERLLEAVSVIADEPTTFATNVVAEPMLEQQAALTSVVAVVDNLPGVSVQEGDTYGFDDWSSSVAVRGFQTNINEAQIGTTIDGFPNGTSDYWSGTKANRFVDPANLGGVEVSQGTADGRLAVGRGPGRHLQLPHRRAGDRAHLANSGLSVVPPEVTGFSAPSVRAGSPPECTAGRVDPRGDCQ